jgi:glycosyltransferase involved in cell wall biosynthesis
LRASLQTKGRERAKAFTWQKTARETLAFYRDILER